MTATLHKIPTKEPASYKDWIRANRKSREWVIQTTRKQSGDLVLTSTGIVRHP